MFQREINPTLAGVVGRKRSHVEVVYRRLREGGQISGTGSKGGGASPRANVTDTAVMLVALASIEQPIEALEALNRARCMIGKGEPPLEVVGVVTHILRELVERGSLNGITDLTLWLGRPWPRGALQLKLDDGGTATVEFNHVDAIGPDADSRRDELERKWGYVPGTGGNRWTAVHLADFMRLADAIANRTREEHPAPSVAEMFAAFARMPPELPGMDALARLPAGFGVFARAPSSPPAPAGKAPSARRRK